MVGQHRQRGPAFPIVQHVHIVQDQRHRRGHRRQRRAEPRHHRAGHRAARGGQRVEYPLANRLDRVQRFGDIGEQDLRVVVPLVQRHPREGPAVALGPLRQQRRLPVPGRRHHRHDRKRPALPQPVNQDQPAHAARPNHGTAQLRHSEPGLKPIRNAPWPRRRKKSSSMLRHSPGDPSPKNLPDLAIRSSAPADPPGDLPAGAGPRCPGHPGRRPDKGAGRSHPADMAGS